MSHWETSGRSRLLACQRVSARSRRSGAALHPYYHYGGGPAVDPTARPRQAQPRRGGRSGGLSAGYPPAIDPIIRRAIVANPRPDELARAAAAQAQQAEVGEAAHQPPNQLPHWNHSQSQSHRMAAPSARIRDPARAQYAYAWRRNHPHPAGTTNLPGALPPLPHQAAWATPTPGPPHRRLLHDGSSALGPWCEPASKHRPSSPWAIPRPPSPPPEALQHRPFGGGQPGSPWHQSPMPGQGPILVYRLGAPPRNNPLPQETTTPPRSSFEARWTTGPLANHGGGGGGLMRWICSQHLPDATTAHWGVGHGVGAPVTAHSLDDPYKLLGSTAPPEEAWANNNGGLWPFSHQRLPNVMSSSPAEHLGLAYDASTWDPTIDGALPLLPSAGSVDEGEIWLSDTNVPSQSFAAAFGHQQPEEEHIPGTLDDPAPEATQFQAASSSVTPFSMDDSYSAEPDPFGVRPPQHQQSQLGLFRFRKEPAGPVSSAVSGLGMARFQRNQPPPPAPPSGTPAATKLRNGAAVEEKGAAIGPLTSENWEASVPSSAAESLVAKVSPDNGGPAPPLPVSGDEQAKAEAARFVQQAVKRKRDHQEILLAREVGGMEELSPPRPRIDARDYPMDHNPSFDPALGGTIRFYNDGVRVDVAGNPLPDDDNDVSNRAGSGESSSCNCTSATRPEQRASDPSPGDSDDASLTTLDLQGRKSLWG